MIYRVNSQFIKEDVAFIFSDKNLDEMKEMVDTDTVQVEQYFVPKGEKVYVAFPDWAETIEDLRIISVPDEIFDPEDWVARDLKQDNKYKRYLKKMKDWSLIQIKQIG